MAPVLQKPKSEKNDGRWPICRSILLGALAQKTSENTRFVDQRQEDETRDGALYAGIVHDKYTRESEMAHYIKYLEIMKIVF